MASQSEEDSHQTHLSRKDFQEYEEDEEENEAARMNRILQGVVVEVVYTNAYHKVVVAAYVTV